MSTLIALEKDVDMYDKHVQQGKALTRLCQNADFKQIFLTEYFQEYLAQQMRDMAKAAPSTPLRERTILNIDGIASLQAYLDSIQLRAESAKVALEQTHEAIQNYREVN